MWFWLFIVSIVLNLFLFFYIRWLFSSLERINEDMGLLSDKIKIFVSHLMSIHEMEMFYGDKTIQGLLTHANSLSDDLDGLDLLLNDLEEKELNDQEIEDEA